MRNSSVTFGRFISADDNDNLAMVVVLGPTTVENLFGSTTANPIGETVRINRQNYEVVGVLKSKGHERPAEPGRRDLHAAAHGPAEARRRRHHDGPFDQPAGALGRGDGPGPGPGDGHPAHAARLWQAAPSNDFTVQNQADILSSVSADYRHVHHSVGQHRRHLAAGGRHRHHEHHAGQRHRAHARDRPAQGGGRQARATSCCSS